MRKFKIPGFSYSLNRLRLSGARMRVRWSRGFGLRPREPMKAWFAISGIWSAKTFPSCR